MREVSDALANPLPADYVNSLLSITPLPQLQIVTAGTNINLAWPVAAEGFHLHSVESLTNAVWDPFLGPVVTSGPNATVTLPATNIQKYYRLKKE